MNDFILEEKLRILEFDLISDLISNTSLGKIDSGNYDCTEPLLKRVEFGNPKIIESVTIEKKVLPSAHNPWSDVITVYQSTVILQIYGSTELFRYRSNVFNNECPPQSEYPKIVYQPMKNEIRFKIETPHTNMNQIISIADQMLLFTKYIIKMNNRQVDEINLKIEAKLKSKDDIL